jgi:endonuclease/exonuclease/phosphatase family metal-dependent hydrolase
MTTAIPPLQESERIEFGGFDRVGLRAEPDASGIVVASYNIRYAVGPFLISGGLLRKAGILGSRKRVSDVAGHIHMAARAFSEGKLLPRVDVLALQEADKRTQRAGEHHVARELAEELQMAWIHVPAGIPRGQKPKPRQWWLDFEEPIGLNDPGDTGVALLSHLPVSDVIRIDLPWQECPWRPRLGMAATISIGGAGSTAERALRIVNAHVDPHAAVGGQLEQLEMLIAEAESFDGPRLILGDFNTLSKRKAVETRNLLEAHGFSTPFPTGTATWRGAAIRLHADWIFYRGLEVTKWGVARPLNVSDHWPIWVELDLT